MSSIPLNTNVITECIGTATTGTLFSMSITSTRSGTTDNNMVIDNNCFNISIHPSSSMAQIGINHPDNQNRLLLDIALSKLVIDSAFHQLLAYFSKHKIEFTNAQYVLSKAESLLFQITPYPTSIVMDLCISKLIYKISASNRRGIINYIVSKYCLEHNKLMRIYCEDTNYDILLWIFEIVDRKALVEQLLKYGGGQIDVINNITYRQLFNKFGIESKAEKYIKLKKREIFDRESTIAILKQALLAEDDPFYKPKGIKLLEDYLNN